MDLGSRTTIVLGSVLLLMGCGGGGSGVGGSIPTRIDVIATAPAHGEGEGFSQMSGFVGGKPAFLSYIDEDHWSVSVVGGSVVDLTTTSFPHAALAAFDGYAVGTYDGGTFAYHLTSSGWSASTMPGLSSPVLDVENRVLIGSVASGFAVVDIATSSESPITLPSDAALYYAKGNFLVYGTSGMFHVRNITTNADWSLTPVAGDSTYFPAAVNPVGGVLGTSGDGTTTRAVYWEPTTGAPAEIDAFADGIVEPGWISPDGTAFVVNVITDQSRSFLYVNGTKYAVADLEGGSAVPYIYGLSDDGKLGFGYTDGSADEDSRVAIKVTYR